MSSTADDVERPNPPRRGLRKGLYLLPSAFTAANIGMGFFSVMSSLRGFQVLGCGDRTDDEARAPRRIDCAGRLPQGRRERPARATSRSSPRCKAC